MSHELILTSVSQGLANAAGYCAVAENAGILPVLRKYLGELSTYHHLQEVDVPYSPVVYAHLSITAEEISYHVLSRIAPTGTDYRHQPNQLAHHIVPNEEELVPEGPAWLCALPEFHLTEWQTPSVRFTQGRPIPSLTSPPSLILRQSIARQQRYLDPQKMDFWGRPVSSEQLRIFIKNIDEQILMSKPPLSPCPVWQEAVGDAGWGGLLADTVQDERKAVILFQPGQHILPLFVESVALLPPDLRWKATFCTYAAEEFPSYVDCQWVGVLAGSPWADKLRQDKEYLVIDLTTPIGLSPPGRYVNFARSGADRDLPDNTEQTKIIEPEDDTPTPVSGIQVFPKESELSDYRTPLVPPLVPQAVPPMPPSQPFIIERRTPKNNWLNSVLTMKGRGQFYLLYGITLFLVLLLLFLVVDQAGGYGIAQRFVGNVKGGSSKIQEKEHQKRDLPIPAEKPAAVIEPAAPTEPEEQVAPVPVQDLEAAPPVSEEDKEKLGKFLAEQKLPAALPMPVPLVDDKGQVLPPPTAVFTELAALFPHTAALELRFQPLFTIPQTTVVTHKENSKEPQETFWRVCTQDTETANETPMFRLTLGEKGLAVDWELDGMESQYLHDTVFLSLGFLDIFVTEKPETVKTVPLFVPQNVSTVRFPFPPPVETPFAAEPWRTVLEDPRFAGLFSLQLEADVVSVSKPDALPPSFKDVTKIEKRSAEPSRFVAAFETNVDYAQPEENGDRYIPIEWEIEGTAAFHQIVWKDRYEEQIRQWEDELEENKGVLTEKKQELEKIRKERMTRPPQESEPQRKQLESEIKTLENEIKGAEKRREKAEAAHNVIADNPDIGVKYRVFLLPVDGESERDSSHEKLLLLQSE